MIFCFHTYLTFADHKTNIFSLVVFLEIICIIVEHRRVQKYYSRTLACKNILFTKHVTSSIPVGGVPISC